ncbi:MAG: SAM-dependent methyltransferase [Sulfurimonas sp.]|nr:SAM-dependent methyltransferase [Sulfurimonas sp.]
MRFSDYMTAWLYAEEGYYATHKEIGKSGDFYTAVSSSMFFGGSIASKFLKTFEEGFLPSDSYIVEIGAHKGYLLADMIQFIYTLKPQLLETLTFVIVEPFEPNRKAQLQYFEESFGDAVKLLHVSSLKELTCKSAFLVANEIFDAFTCEVIKDGKMLYMDEHKPEFKEMDSKIKETADKYKITKGEIGLGYEEFAKDMCEHIDTFEFVTFDYGDIRGREDISLRVYDKHKVYQFFALTDLVEDKELREDINLDSVYANSDITYDVNFEHLIGAFSEAGASLHDYSSQMKALVEFGLIELLDMMQKNANAESYKAEVNRVKTLIDPAFMGERFKMACFRKESN